MDTGPITFHEIKTFREMNLSVPHLGGVSTRGLNVATSERVVLSFPTRPLTERVADSKKRGAGSGVRDYWCASSDGN